MYWIHRIGRGVDNTYAIHFDALWYLLKERHCLTIGWHYVANNKALVAAVENHNSAQVNKLLQKEGEYPQETRGLVNFSQFKVGDIVAVLPISEYEENFCVVEIKSSAQSILKVTDDMKGKYSVNLLEPSGRNIDFKSDTGFVYVADNKPVEAGFFCRVDVLKVLPLSSRSNEFKILCDNVKSTNAPLTNYNSTMIPLEKFYSRITRP